MNFEAKRNLFDALLSESALAQDWLRDGEDVIFLCSCAKATHPVAHQA